MKLTVISPTGEEPRETRAVLAMLSAGLEFYHVRKPSWPRERFEAWLRAIPPEFRSRLVMHSHHELALEMGIGGCHWRDEEGQSVGVAPEGIHTCRSCHGIEKLKAALGRYDAVFFGPVFPSISKPGYGPDASFSKEQVGRVLRNRGENEWRTTVTALGGITARRVEHCRELGFDGVAVLGAVWATPDPVAAFLEIQKAAATPRLRAFPVMCLTQDGLPLSHAEQAARLCAAGAKWIQLRMKEAGRDALFATAREVASICRSHGAVCIVNDSVDAALDSGADGVHLGADDGDWRDARRRIGPHRILGGTVNDAAGTKRASGSGCLDYVGLGPLRFTETKRKLSPVLGLDRVRALLAQLDGLPAWVIGGVRADDLPVLRSAGAAGVAVSSALYREGRVEGNFGELIAAWDSPADLAAGVASPGPSASTGPATS